LRAIERALLERHLTRLLQFSPSLEEACKFFRGDAPDLQLGEGLDAYDALIRHAVFALMSTGVAGDELLEGATRPERLVRLLFCARQRALPMLMSWLLPDKVDARFQLSLSHTTQCKVVDALRLSVRQELQATRAFIADFLLTLGEQTSAGEPMGTHLPETFICDGDGSFNESEALSFEKELNELRGFYKTSSVGGKISMAAVTDILDPSLRCRVYSDENVGLKYQWLPTDFHVTVDGSVAVLSPLHGSVHPHQFPALHAHVPRLLGRMRPLFEHVLGSLARQDPPPPHHVGLGSTDLVCTSSSLNEPFELCGRLLQVAVKISTIHLDEAQPAFARDQDAGCFNRGWQLDGDNHEHMVAVGYHVLRARNITPARLSFRAFAHSADSGLGSQEDEFLAYGERTSAFHRGRYGRQFLQSWGSLALHEGRSIVVPSLLTHRLEPFRLLDGSSPEGGELTFATFYLVDPTIESIVSTRTVRPAQWQQTRRFVQANVDMLCRGKAIPHELAGHIADFAASHVSESRARLARQQLMLQRQKLQELRFMAPSLRLEEMTMDLNN
jgi:hypothetical protein